MADDFWLREFTRRLGLRTVLSPVVVTTDVTEKSLAQLWAHELRWLRTIRAVAPVGFAFSFVTFTLPILAVGVALAPTKLCAAIAAAGVLARVVLHCGRSQFSRGRPGLADLFMLPPRDPLSFAEWAAAHFDSRVEWRGQSLDAFAARPASGKLPELRASTGRPLLPD